MASSGSGLDSSGLLRKVDVVPSAAATDERARLQKRLRLLAWGGSAWHLIEFAVAVGAGIAAGSVALVGFGADSLIELLSGSVIVWLFGARQLGGERAERRAQQLLAASYALLVGYLLAASLLDLIVGRHPQTSWVGIALAALTAPTMPLLARAKRRLGQRLGSSAAVSDAQQSQICAYLSVALLLGLLANALIGWWWADAIAAIAIAALAAYEGREAWRGKRCDCC